MVQPKCNTLSIIISIDGLPSLHNAARNGHSEDNFGLTPLHDAAKTSPFWLTHCDLPSLTFNLVNLSLKFFNQFITLTRKPASRVFLAPPEGLMKFLSSLYHAWQLLLAKFFDLVKLEFWPPGPPEPPGGQGSNLNSLFRALRWEG